MTVWGACRCVQVHEMACTHVRAVPRSFLAALRLRSSFCKGCVISHWNSGHLSKVRLPCMKDTYIYSSIYSPISDLIYVLDLYYIYRLSNVCFRRILFRTYRGCDKISRGKSEIELHTTTGYSVPLKRWWVVWVWIKVETRRNRLGALISEVVVCKEVRRRGGGVED